MSEPQKVRDVMTTEPRTIDVNASAVDAAAAMREADVGSLLVEEDGTLCGVVTDRDLTVRALAERRDPAQVRVGDIASRDLITATPDSDAEQIIALMRKRAIRRVPVVDERRIVGVVSLGDLTLARDRASALADISAAPPNR